jgi:hypothetical protein
MAFFPSATLGELQQSFLHFKQSSKKLPSTKYQGASLRVADHLLPHKIGSAVLR